nr:putative protein SNX29P2 isoform X1 [Pan troglodytes]
MTAHQQALQTFPFFWTGPNSILFAINIDNKDLNRQSKFAPTVSDLLKESTQNVTLLKESTQGVSSLFREITASSAISILIKPEQETDPLPVVSRNVSADAKCKKERKKKKKVTNIISFDDEEDEQNSGDMFKKTSGAGESSEDNSDRSSVNIMSAFESPFGPNSNGSQSSNSWKIDSLSLNREFGYQKLDVKSIDDEDVDENEDDVYGNSSGRKHRGHSESPEKCCHGHDCCYTRAEEAGCSPKTERYSWQCVNQSVLCGESPAAPCHPPRVSPGHPGIAR